MEKEMDKGMDKGMETQRAGRWVPCPRKPPIEIIRLQSSSACVGMFDVIEKRAPPAHAQPSRSPHNAYEYRSMIRQGMAPSAE